MSIPWRLALAAVPQDRRTFRAVPIIVDAVRHDRLNPAAAAAAVGRHEAGCLRLGALTSHTERAFEQGGFRGLWPAGLAIADALCAVAARPSSLPAFLRLLTAYAHEVPAACVTEIPTALRALAESSGSTQSQVEARRLVQALRRAGDE